MKVNGTIMIKTWMKGQRDNNDQNMDESQRDNNDPNMDESQRNNNDQNIRLFDSVSVNQRKGKLMLM